MKIREILTDKRYGKVLILNDFWDETCKRSRLLYRCDCGKEKVVRKDHFVKKYPKSCGCTYQKPRADKSHRFIKLTGKRRNNFIITKEFVEDDINKVVCLCDCGKEFIKNRQNIVSYQLKSCGCKSSKLSENHTLKGYKQLTGTYWGIVVSNASRRKIEISIDIKYAYKIFTKQKGRCAITGDEIELKREKQTASLDRIDSSIGYIEGNVQWVHKDINRFKNNYTMEELLTFCQKIVNYNKKVK